MPTKLGKRLTPAAREKKHGLRAKELTRGGEMVKNYG
jgi:hypothetical protein